MVSGYVSLLYSISEKPLEYWSKRQSQSGRIRKILDSDLLENVIEIQDFEQHSYGTSILCPFDSSQVLNIQLPILVVIIKNLSLQCRLQLQVVDTQNCLHHFQFSNSESDKPNSKGVICRVKVKLETGWNKLELNLSTLTETVFKSEYAATQRLQICGNCRLRRVYFIDKHYENQEICPRLYQGFLDSYMLKWGIHSIERSTQTSCKRSKSRVKVCYNSKDLAKRHSTDNVAAEETSFKSAKNSAARKTVEENFLNCLQVKTDVLIHDFFSRRSARASRALEFRQQTKLKPYALPVQNMKQKLSNSLTISEDALKKINVLRTFTETDVCDNSKHKQDEVKSIQDNWKHRYCLPNEFSNNKDAKQGVIIHSKRTMLDRKPKSLLILSEMKAGNAKMKLPLLAKKSAEIVNRNEENNTAV